MAAPPRRTTAAPAPVAAGYEVINIGSLEAYSSGGGVPEGNYCVYFDAIIFDYKQKTGGSKGNGLGIMATLQPLNDLSQEATKDNFYSMGRKAIDSFMPNPETGKSIVRKPDGAGAALYQETDWQIFLNSLYQAGLPPGVFTGDLTAIDGIWVHIHNIPEPESRKGMRSATAEVEEQGSRPKTIPVVTEILQGGEPWNGGGGLPTATTAAAAVARPAAAAPRPAPAAARPVPVAARVAPVAAAPAPVAAAPAAELDADTREMLSGSLADALGKAPAGAPKGVIRTNSFKHAQATYGDEMAQYLTGLWGDEALMNTVLADLGYQISGVMVKPLQ